MMRWLSKVNVAPSVSKYQSIGITWILESPILRYPILHWSSRPFPQRRFPENSVVRRNQERGWQLGIRFDIDVFAVHSEIGTLDVLACYKQPRSNGADGSVSPGPAREVSSRGDA